MVAEINRVARVVTASGQGWGEEPAKTNFGKSR